MRALSLIAAIISLCSGLCVAQSYTYSGWQLVVRPIPCVPFTIGQRSIASAFRAGSIAAVHSRRFEDLDFDLEAACNNGDAFTASAGHSWSDVVPAPHCPYMPARGTVPARFAHVHALASSGWRDPAYTRTSLVFACEDAPYLYSFGREPDGQPGWQRWKLAVPCVPIESHGVILTPSLTSVAVETAGGLNEPTQTLFAATCTNDRAIYYTSGDGADWQTMYSPPPCRTPTLTLPDGMKWHASTLSVAIAPFDNHRPSRGIKIFATCPNDAVIFASDDAAHTWHPMTDMPPCGAYVYLSASTHTKRGERPTVYLGATCAGGREMYIKAL